LFFILKADLKGFKSSNSYFRKQANCFAEQYGHSESGSNFRLLSDWMFPSWQSSDCFALCNAAKSIQYTSTVFLMKCCRPTTDDITKLKDSIRKTVEVLWTALAGTEHSLLSDALWIPL
jgi:hypothetical protein